MAAAVTTDVIDVNACYQQLDEVARESAAGAIVTFTGVVRDFNHAGHIDGLFLEHYPGMTESALNTLITQACKRFNLHHAAIVHRVGALANHDTIVWVGCVSAHRQAAFDAACYIMDTLKQAVPIWKQELKQGEATWVKAKGSDAQAAMKWLSENDKDA